MIVRVTFKFNRPVKINDSMTIGGFAVSVGEKQYCFDFMEYYGYIDKRDPLFVEYEGRELDTDTFPESRKLEESMGQIVSLDECSIDTDDESLYLVEIIDFELISETEDEENRIILSDQIIDAFNQKIRNVLLEEQQKNKNKGEKYV